MQYENITQAFVVMLFYKSHVYFISNLYKTIKKGNNISNKIIGGEQK